MKQTENERFKILRENLKLTQKELGDLTTINIITLSRIETNAQEASAKTRRKICETFNIRMEWLTEGKGEMFVSGTAEENRKLAMNKGTALSGDSNPWKDALVETLKAQNELLSVQIERLTQAVVNLSGKANFLKRLNYAAGSQKRAA